MQCVAYITAFKGCLGFKRASTLLYKAALGLERVSKCVDPWVQALSIPESAAKPHRPYSKR